MSSASTTDKVLVVAVAILVLLVLIFGNRLAEWVHSTITYGTEVTQ